jgi:hypothetical protein
VLLLTVHPSSPQVAGGGKRRPHCRWWLTFPCHATPPWLPGGGGGGAANKTVAHPEPQPLARKVDWVLILRKVDWVDSNSTECLFKDSKSAESHF